MDATETAGQTTASRRTPGGRRGVISPCFAVRLATALLAVLAVLTVPLAQPASAARSITPASNLTCERYDNKLSITAPRVWASYRTEQVTWGLAIQRWNGRAWVDYTTTPYYFYASFTYFGASVTSWTSGWYVNNTLNVPVYHSGYYRAYSAVWGNQGGVTQQGWVDAGRYCYVA